MTSNRKERLALVTKRLEDELVQQNDFSIPAVSWHLAVKSAKNHTHT